MALSSSGGTTVFGQSVTFTATVTSTVSGLGSPTGTVMFFGAGTRTGSGTLIGTGTLKDGVASFVTDSLTVGSDFVNAVYGGDTNFGNSKSSLVSQVVSR